MLLVLVGGVMSAQAYDLYLRCNLNATQDNSWYSWDNDVPDYKFESLGNNGSENVFAYTIDASSWEGDINFRLHNSDWGNTQQIPYQGNSCEWSFENTLQEHYEIWAANDNYKSDYYPNKYFTIKHGNIGASKYKIMVYWRTSDNRIWMTVDILSMPVSIKAEGYGTFSCDRALDFTDCDVTPYVATGYSDGKVTMEKVTKVPANTGLFLKGTPGTALNSSISVIANDAEGLFSGVNLLKHGTGGTVNSDGTTYRYVFQASDLSFKKLSTTGTTVPKGKAYLELPANQGAPSLSIELDGETTGIKVINFEEENTQNDGQMFDLQGRRVAEPTKGVYIVNGKKVIIK